MSAQRNWIEPLSVNATVVIFARPKPEMNMTPLSFATLTQSDEARLPTPHGCAVTCLKLAPAFIMACWLAGLQSLMDTEATRSPSFASLVAAEIETETELRRNSCFPTLFSLSLGKLASEMPTAVTEPSGCTVAEHTPSSA